MPARLLLIYYFGVTARLIAKRCAQAFKDKMRLLTFILLKICSTTFGQPTKAKDKKQRTLTYYTFGMGPGQYVDTESLYSFKMKWKKCVIKPRHIRHNKKVERKINERLGENWLADNFHKLEVGHSNENN